MFGGFLNRVSPDDIPDAVGSGINHEELTGFLLIIILILFTILIFVTIKYLSVKEKYEDLKNRSKNAEENTEESDK